MATRSDQSSTWGRVLRRSSVLLAGVAVAVLGTACGSSPSASNSTTTTALGPATTVGPGGGTGAGNLTAFCRINKNVLVGTPQLSFQGTYQSPVVAVNGQTDVSGAPVKSAEQARQQLINAYSTDTPGLDAQQLQPMINAYNGLLGLIRQDNYDLKVVNKAKGLAQFITPLVNLTTVEQTTLGTLSDRCAH